MKYIPEKHHRHSIRLKGYDYSQPGAYFITICTHNREYLFGDVVNGKMTLNECGKLIEFTWYDLPNHNPHIALDTFTIMPNHIHGIVNIYDVIIVGAGSEPAPTTTIRRGLPEIVRQFKTFSSKRINQINQTPGAPMWQRNYYEHIIRNEDELNRVREYILNNPLQWEFDRENHVGAYRNMTLQNNKWQSLEGKIYGKTK